MRLLLCAMLLTYCLPGAAPARDSTVAASITALKAVGPEGRGNEAAAAAWKELTAQGVPALIPILEAFRDASPLAQNWLRSAVDAIVEKNTQAGGKLPVEQLTALFQDSAQHAAARRIAYELFAKVDDAAAKALIARMIDDPGLDIRRDAIDQRLLSAGDDPKMLEPLFAAARDRDQVEAIAKKLGKKREDVVRHFNFIPRWHIIGPFDAPGGGYQTVFPPESGVDLKAQYDGKGGEKIAWKTLATADTAEQGGRDYCMIDFVKALGPHKNAVAFAHAVVEVDREATVELRGASQNAVRFFVNGKQVYEREIYHQGTIMDQHECRIVLRPGRNEILCKICQNDQKEPWAQVWLFQARLCDSTGGPVPFKLISPVEGE